MKSEQIIIEPIMLRFKSLFLFFAVAVTLIAFTGCQSGDSYRKLIPADATLVCSSNLQTLSQDSKFGDSELSSKILDYLDDLDDSDIQEKIEAIVKDPAESGIDLRKPVYFFMTSDYSGLVMKVYKEKKVEEMLELLHDYDSSCSKVKDEDDYKYVNIEDGWVVGFNDDALIMLFSIDGEFSSNRLKREIAKLMSQDEDDQYFAHDNPFDDAAEAAPLCVMVKGKIIDCLPLDSYDKRELDEFNSIYKSVCGIKIEDMNVFYTVTFEKNEAVLKAKVYCNDESDTKKLIGNLPYKTLKGDYAGYTPDDDDEPIVVAAGLDGSKIVDMMKALPQYDMLVENAKSNGIDVIDVIKSIDGDMMFTLTDYYTGDWREEPEYVFGYYGTFTSTDFAQDLIDLVETADITNVKSIGDGQYLIGDDNFSVHVGIRDKKLFVSKKPLAEAKTGGADYVSEMKSNVLYARIVVPDILLRKEFKGPRILKTITAKARITDVIESEIRLTSDDDESVPFLETVVEWIDDNID